MQIDPDAGKICSDQSDCLGTCRYDGDAARGSTVLGIYQSRDIAFGGYALVDKGVVLPALCAD